MTDAATLLAMLAAILVGFDERDRETFALLDENGELPRSAPVTTAPTTPQSAQAPRLHGLRNLGTGKRRRRTA